MKRKSLFKILMILSVLTVSLFSASAYTSPSEEKIFLHLNESSSPAIDYSGNNNNLSYSGTLTTGLTGVNFNDNKAYNFTTSNGYLETSDDPTLNFDGTNEVSFSFWVKSKSTVDKQPVFSKWDDDQQYLVRFNNGVDDNLNVLVGGTNCGGLTTDWNTGDWNHYGIAFDGSNVFVYRNNTLEGTISCSTTLKSTNDLFEIGHRTGANNNLDAALDEPRVFNKNISSNEINNLYNDNQLSNTNKSDVKFYNFQPADQSTAYINGDQIFEVTVEANSTQYSSIDIEGIYDGNIEKVFNHPADGGNKTFNFTLNDLNKTGDINYKFSAISSSPGGTFINDTEFRTLNVESDDIQFTLNNPSDNKKFYKPLTENITINYNIDVTTGNNESWKYELSVTDPNGNTNIPVSGTQPSNFSFTINTDQNLSELGSYSWFMSGEGQESGDTVQTSVRTFEIKNESASINFIKPNSNNRIVSDSGFNVGVDNKTNERTRFKLYQANNTEPGLGYEKNCTLNYSGYDQCMTFDLDNTKVNNPQLIVWNKNLSRDGLKDTLKLGVRYEDNMRPAVGLYDPNFNYQGRVVSDRKQFSGDSTNPMFNLTLKYYPDSDAVFMRLYDKQHGTSGTSNITYDPDKNFKLGFGGAEADKADYFLYYGNGTMNIENNVNASAYVESIPYEADVKANTNQDKDAKVEFIHDGVPIKTYNLEGNGTEIKFSHNEIFNNTEYNKLTRVSVLGTDFVPIAVSSFRNVSVVQKPEFYLLKPNDTSEIEVDSYSNKIGKDETTFEGIINIGESGKAVLQLKNPNGTIKNVTSETYNRNDVGNNKTILDVEKIKDISLSKSLNKSVLISDYYNWSLDYYGNDSLQKFDSKENSYRYVTELLSTVQKITDVIVGFFGEIDDYIQDKLDTSGKIFASIILSSILGILIAGLAKLAGSDGSTAGLIFIFITGISLLGFAIKGYMPAWILGALIVVASALGVKSINNTMN